MRPSGRQIGLPILQIWMVLSTALVVTWLPHDGLFLAWLPLVFGPAFVVMLVAFMVQQRQRREPLSWAALKSFNNPDIANAASLGRRLLTEGIPQGLAVSLVVVQLVGHPFWLFTDRDIARTLLNAAFVGGLGTFIQYRRDRSKRMDRS